VHVHKKWPVAKEKDIEIGPRICVLFASELDDECTVIRNQNIID